VTNEKLGIAGHAEPVVGDTMQKQNGVSISLSGNHRPGAQCDAIRSIDLYGLKPGAEGVRDANRCGLHGWG